MICGLGFRNKRGQYCLICLPPMQRANAVWSCQYLRFRVQKVNLLRLAFVMAWKAECVQGNKVLSPTRIEWHIWRSHHATTILPFLGQTLMDESDNPCDLTVLMKLLAIVKLRSS